MRPDNIEDIYPLSPVQQGILFHTLYAPEAGDYFRQLVFAIQGNLDIVAFARTWQEVVDRHPILRTAFVWEDADEPLQVVCRKVETPLEQWDWRSLDTTRQEACIADHLHQERRKGFALSETPVMRLALFRLGDERYRFVWSYHHLLLDGWSVALLLRKVFAVYRALTRGERLPLDRVRPYRDYIAWLKSQDLARAEAFWRRTLEGFLASTPLPLDVAGPETERLTDDRLIALPAELTASLQGMARAYRLTLNTVLQGAWALLLSRYSRESDVVFGATASGRPTDLSGFESMVGLFINTLPVRVPAPAGADLLAWLRRIQALQAEARQFEYAPLVDILRWSDLPRGQALFESILVFENYRIDEAMPERDSQLEVRRLDLVDGTSYPISLIVRPEPRLVLRLLYDASRLGGPAALRLLGHLSGLLRSFAVAPHGPLASFSLLREEERQQVVLEWNATETAERGDLCLHELFSLQARRSAESVALVFEDQTLTYQELDRRSSQLAACLRSLGVGPETRVGLCLERSLEMVVALLGVLKAGGAYVPIDPSYPAQRQTWMMEDSAAPIVLCQQRLISRLPSTGARILPLDAAADEIASWPDEGLGLCLPDESLAYVIYTSGSTGKPKGAMNTHRAVRNRILWMQEAYHLDASDRVLQKTPFSFDVSVWEFFWPLLTGARLVIARPEGHRDPTYLADLIREQEITTLHFVPPMLQAFLEEPSVPSCRSLRRVICSGEALPADLERRFFDRLEAELHNLYGPTEAAVDVTYWACQRGASHRSVPIGRPISNIRIHLLDPHLHPSPVGIPGELNIGGIGLARGYLGRPDMTAEKFVPDPLAASAGERLYKTGDLGRLLADGSIEFLGRLDHQVKIRGFRIELGEIEAALIGHPEIREVVALARDDHGSGKRLVAYLVSDRELSAGELRAYLQASLPDHMIPALFVHLPALPLSPNGKVNRAALPAPEGFRSDSGRPFMAPRNEVEQGLAEIWQEVLRTSRVGIDDNFFELGGDSIRSIQVLARARGRGLPLSLPQLFRYPTIRELSAQVGKAPDEELPAAEAFSLVSEDDRTRLPEGIVDAYPLAFLQAGMLFHSELRPESSVYHDVFSYHFDIALDPQALHRALRRLLGRHPVLRTSFHLTGFSEPLQLVHADVEVPLAVADLRHLPQSVEQQAVDDWIAAEKRNPLPWTSAPLLRFQVHLRTKGASQLTLSFHHAILDGWSVAAMLAELFHLYQEEVGEREAAVTPPPALAFRQFVALERATLGSGESRRFWLEQLDDSNFLSLPRWPLPRQAPGLRIRRVAVTSEVSDGLWRLASSASVPLKSVLLAAHLRVLALVGGQAGRWDLVTGLVANGRPEVADGDRLLGLFLNTLPLRLKMAGGTWTDLVRATFEAERQILAHRRFPLSELQRLLSGQPLFETVFNYVHFHVRDDLQRASGLQAIGGASYEETNFPLYVNFRLRPSSTAVELDLRYDAAEVAKEHAETLADRFARTLFTMGADPLAGCEAVSLLSAAEKQQLLIEWNDSAAVAPDLPVHRLFEAQAARAPAALALIHEGRGTSYAELNARANRLARRLRSAGVGPEVPVAICIERSPEMLIAALAVLKAGGAYTPLDPAHPRQRLELVMDDLGGPLLLATGSGAEDLALHARLLLRVEEAPGSGDASNLDDMEAQFANLAYVIYTSGSTGRPKGVGISHGALANFLGSMRSRTGLSEQDVLLAVTTFSFDIAGLELFLPLVMGGRVVIADRESTMDAGLLALLLLDATVMQATPATWRLLLENGWEGQSGLAMLCGGEALARDLADTLAARGARLINLYGPTETTIWSTLAKVETGPGPVTIGSPIDNTEIHILDALLQPVPIGVTAELWIGGDGLARGYVGQPGLTAVKFLPHPFASRQGERLYRTGDLARRLPDGRLEHLGRLDHQLKVRGFRIEPGEIEAVLREHPSVRQALVVLREHFGDRRLVAYVVAESRPALASEIRDLVRTRLPEYMVPSALVLLDAFPLTPSGKVDRRALPAPDRDDHEALRKHIPPRTPIEEILAGLWSDVLGRERVGASDDFFVLGGHSLSATRVVARIREVFSVEFPLRTLFEAPVLSDLAERVETRLRSGVAFDAAPIVPIPRQGDLDLSFGQERIWFLDQLEPGSASYNIPLAVRLEGVLDRQALENAFAGVVARHETLRSTFPSRQGRPVQVIGLFRPLDLCLVDLSGTPAGRREPEARRLAREEFSRPFDLAADPMLRARLVRLDEEEHALFATVHHIVSDAWSMGLLVRELAELYTARCEGRPPTLPDLPIQYADFARWQREQLQGSSLENDLTYWRKRLYPLPAALDLPTDRRRPAVRSTRGHREPFPVTPELAAGLHRLSRREGASLFMILLSAFQTVLHLHTGQSDFAIGMPIAGRTRVEVEPLIGLFINTLVLPCDVSDDLPFSMLLSRVRETCLEAHAHQLLPFEQLVEHLQPERDLTQSPLFQAMLVFQNAPHIAVELPGLRLGPMGIGTEAAKFDLTLTLTDDGTALGGSLLYSTELWDRSTILHLLNHLRLLLAAVIEDTGRYLSDLPVLGESEQAQLLVEWSDGGSIEPSPSAFFHRIFEEWARKVPDADALVFEDERWTYAELERRANRIARVLLSRGLEPEAPIGLCLERSATAILALLAIFKAGGACVPLDPALPRERLKFMVAESRILRIITESRWLDVLGKSGRERALCLDDLSGEIDAEDGSPVHVPLTDENLAYVLFTSGSTGRPKGVAVEHRQLLHYIRAVARALDIQPGMSFATVSTLSADLGHTAIFPTLSLGGCLHVISDARIADADLLVEYFERHQVDGLKIVPSHLAALQGALGDRVPLVPRRLLVLGGEVSYREEMARLQTLAPDLLIFNHYGPTETTVGVLTHRFDIEERSPSLTVPLGRPLQGVSAYVLDPHLRPVPRGVSGELCVAGLSVSRGYLHHPDLTAERFRPNPFGPPGDRFYQTGDLVRHLPDGLLKFLGRNDDQIKRRGFRVEFGEIETALKQYPGLREAVVVVRKEGKKQLLVGYGVPEAGAALTQAELRTFLRERLPEYMVPNAFVLLPELPLTPNGKVDRSALPAPAQIHGAGQRERALPRTATEEILAGLWRELLGTADLGVRDSFFDLGGHSLLATRLISRVRRTFDVELPLRTLFERPTIEGFAAAVETAIRDGRTDEAPPIRPVSRDADLPLSFSQERLWLAAQMDPESPAYNVPAALLLEGALDVVALRFALSELVRRHEVLRTRFVAARGEARQVVSSSMPVPVPVIDLGGMPEPWRDWEIQRLTAAEARRPFDLESDPPLRAALVRLGAGEHLALLTLHHIASDAWSRAILLRELGELYVAAVQGRAPNLPNLPVQYADFAHWQRSWFSGERLEKEVTYWRDRLAGAPRVLDLPTDRPQIAAHGSRGGSVPLALSEDLTVDLEALGPRQGVTLFMTLLAAFQILLSRCSHQTDVLVGTPVAGRDRIEIEDLIGFFVNTLVMRTDLSGNPSFAEVLASIRRVALESHSHQALPFESVMEALEREGSAGGAPSIQAVFVLQNAPRESLDLPGLTLKSLDTETGATKFDLTVIMARRPGGLRGAIEYRKDLFDRSTVLRWARQLEVLLSAAANDCDRRYSALPMATSEELHQILAEWNDTAVAYPSDRCIHQLFEEQAARTPDAPAVVFGSERLTYHALDLRSANLARRLRKLGVGMEDRVGLCAERSTGMIVALLGILRAGAAYLPLDLSYPQERLHWMLRDGGVKILLAERQMMEKLTRYDGVRVLCLEELDCDELGETEAALPSAPVDALAYVMYTSGSTGTPKGVGVTHRNVVRLVRGSQYASMDPREVWLQYAPASFDASTLEVWAPLLNGGCVALVPGSQASLEELAGAIQDEGVTSLWLTAGLFHQMVDNRLEGLRPLSQLLTGGDVVSPIHARQVLTALPGLTLVNGYGPTEATTFTCCHRMTDPGEVGLSVAIGRPIANGRVYLVDRDFGPVPIGVAGELCAAGDGLARGYLDRSDLTAVKFVPDPCGEPGGRMYRTGDLARFLPSGEIEFLGRIDHQVKIRGYRIEPGEIEAALTLHSAVRDALVAVRRDDHGERFLAAYVAIGSAAEDSVEQEGLRQFLRQSLPEFMVPSSFAFLEALPLTPNGKVDRQALSAMHLAGWSGSSKYVAPRTPEEEALALIWAEVLRIEQVGVLDDFFELGGHSLRATQVVSRVRESFGVELPLRIVFENPTIERLVAALEQLRSEPAQDEALASALDELEGLSEEEVRLLLAEQRRLSEGIGGV
ncbi:MAG TPA: amino acid adenylation domain-containing protein [Thermoanaerobaculia bacterium]|nr:amino acid adenylation domain-containing protein [Thermoanaerobaculia bacterium]